MEVAAIMPHAFYPGEQGEMGRNHNFRTQAGEFVLSSCKPEPRITDEDHSRRFG